MSPILRTPLVLFLLVVSTGGCAATSPSASPAEPGLAMAPVARIVANPADAALAADAINDFGLEVLQEGTARDANAVLSPASIVLALAMARAGARGQTAAEMDAVLRRAATDDHASWLNALEAALGSRTGTFKNAFDKDAEITLGIANQSFAQTGLAWEPAYLEALAARFGAGLRLVDYIENTEGARRDINGWVGDRTEGRIPQLLPQGSVDDMTRLVLVNAIYLKAAWLSPFEQGSTNPASFHLLDGSSVDVPTMHDTASLLYASGDDWQAVELPYAGRQLAMMVILPDELPTFEATLDGGALAAIVAALEDQRVELSLPRFGIETEVDLNDVLARMGMPLAFDPKAADFSGMTSAADLCVSGVIHQANIDVDEEGTEASAATAVVVGVTSMPPEPIPMAVNRPFLFALRDLETGAVLFLGRVVEPVERN